MVILTTCGNAEKKEAASAFEDTGMEVGELMFALDMRLGAAALGEGVSLKSWLKENGSDITGIVFNAGEFFPQSFGEPCAYIMTWFGNAAELGAMLGRKPIAGLGTAVIEMTALSAHCCEDLSRSEWRALFSGELLILGTSAINTMGILDTAYGIQGVFENGNVLGDLSMLLAKDVSTKAYGASGKKEVYLSDGELQTLIRGAMVKRRVEKGIRRRLVPEVRKILTG